jgi:hypothetical protein
LKATVLSPTTNSPPRFFKTSYVFLLLLTGLPTTVAYWMLMSRANVRVRDNGVFPNKPIDEYITIKDAALKEKYGHGKKIPMQIFHDAYFEGKIDIKGASSCSHTRVEEDKEESTSVLTAVGENDFFFFSKNGVPMLSNVIQGKRTPC